MNIHNMPYQYEKENRPKLSQIHLMSAILGFCYGLKNEFEIAVVNEPSVFEPPKFYCISNYTGAEPLHVHAKIY